MVPVMKDSSQATRRVQEERAPQEGRSTIIVGGSSGIGRELARQLLADGERVVVIGRDLAGARAALPEVAALALLRADLSLGREVAALAKELSRRGPLHRLVFTAGVVTRERRATAEGHDISLMTNHISRRVLSEALLPHLLEASRPRIGYLSPWGDYSRPLSRYDDLDVSRGGMAASMSTQLPNDVFFASLAARASGLAVLGFNPGPTGGTQLTSRDDSPLLLRWMLRIAVPLVGRTVEATAASFRKWLDSAPPGLTFVKGDREIGPPRHIDDGAHREAVEQLARTVLGREMPRTP